LHVLYTGVEEKLEPVAIRLIRRMMAAVKADFQQPNTVRKDARYIPVVKTLIAISQQ
jgi:hypothetical protein